MSEYPKPSITADIIVFDISSYSVLLIKRKSEPYKDCWAIPGGFFNPEAHNGEPMDESIRHAAKRELKEEVDLDFDLEDFHFVTIQDAPLRDPRSRVVTMVYAVVKRYDDTQVAVAKDDAAELKWVELKGVIEGQISLAFDHLDSIKKFVEAHDY